MTVMANLLAGSGVDECLTRTDSAGARNFLADPPGSTVALGDSTRTAETSDTCEPIGNTADRYKSRLNLALGSLVASKQAQA